MNRTLVKFVQTRAAGLAIGFCAAFPAWAQSHVERLEAGTQAALTRFKADVKGASDYLAAAKGVLVVPDATKVGLVLAGQYGEGALQIDGKTVGYYKMEVGSFGLQAGYQKATFIFLFLTQQALDKFLASNGWTVGVEGGITVVEAGFGTSIDTLKGQNAVVAFPIGKEGLMAGWSAKGTKFSKFVPKD